jgi:hypothetical protein
MFFSAFLDTDFRHESEDSNRQRADPLKLRLLKKDAVPSVFPNVPAYLSSSAPEPRSATATSSARYEREAARVEEEAVAFMEEDEVSSLSDLLKKLDDSCIPEGIHKIKQGKELFFVAFSKDEYSGPCVVFSLVLSARLEMTMFSRGIRVPLEQVAHITGLCATVDSCSQVLNVLSFLKVYSESRLPGNDTIRHCVLLLDTIIPEAEEELRRKLAFIREQLDLATRVRRQRCYSALLLATAVMWDNVSPSLYRQMVSEDVITLPGEK